ncbi:hypothetical protein ACFP81_12140 [Deinococcus lacus]|uniref:Alpha/beta hydrolase n=1 Tax=Deinococcus lacus TaxID=392561 RepID=A0ABW1YF74_9DEIO
MPILYIHGVAIRRPDEAGWDAVSPFLTGLDWASVERQLREHIAPVLNQNPESVSIQEIFWGDLGGSPLLPDSPEEKTEALPDPADLSPQVLADLLEGHLRQVAPLMAWPQAIAAAEATAADPLTRQAWLELPAAAQWEALQRSAEQRLHEEWERAHSGERRPLFALLRRDIRRYVMGSMLRMRGPLEDFMPYFMGDVLGYPLQRGTAENPGPIPQQVLAELRRAHQLKQQTGEPIVVLTHSMGGQILYDALATYAPACPDLQGLQVDFWAAAASQLSLYASLNLYAEPTPPAGIMPPLSNLGYLWNLWSPADLLSFQAFPAIPEAADIRLPLTEDIMKAHLAYITTPLFYELLAAKLRARLTLTSTAAQTG